MAEDWTLVIAIATTITAVLGFVTLVLLEHQRRISQSNPMWLFPAEKIELLSLMESDSRGDIGEELKAGVPSIVRSADTNSASWSNAVEKLVQYGLAEVSNGYLRITEAGKRYAWRKYQGEVRAILLKIEEQKHSARR